MPDYLLQLTLDLLTPIMLALGSWVVAELIRLVRTKVHNEKVRAAIERAVHVTSTAVGEVHQTFVTNVQRLSTDGKLTKQESKQALNAALSTAKSHLGPRGIAELKRVLGSGTDQDLQAYLVSLIEAQIAKSKAEP